MKRLPALAFALVCAFLFAGCSANTVKVWDWAQGLEQADIASAIPRSGVDGSGYAEFEPLDNAETLELVALLNGLTKASFTQNRYLRGITPSYHIEINTASETYYINEANSPSGALEMSYAGKQWWVDDAALAEFVKSVTVN